jgi:hypothetical protein
VSQLPGIVSRQHPMRVTRLSPLRALRVSPLRLIRLPVLLLAIATGCGEEDLLGTRPRLRQGSSRIWEVSAADLPSAFDVFNGRRLFLGGGDVGPVSGDIFLDGSAAGGPGLRLRSVASLLRAGVTPLAEIRDLGPVAFEELREVPDEGYHDAADTTGAAVVEGHVYALRLRRSELAPNYAKLVVDRIGSSSAGGPRFVDLRFVVQVQPGNRRFEEE